MNNNNSNYEIDIQLASANQDIPSNADLLHWIGSTLAIEMPAAEISLRIIDEAEMQTLNNTYRKKNKPTNVLSFPFESPMQLDPPHLGDIVICASVVNSEADQQGKARAAHWAHMVVHGIYHLLGFDHVDDAEALIMENLEIKALEKLNFPNPYFI